MTSEREREKVTLGSNWRPPAFKANTEECYSLSHLKDYSLTLVLKKKKRVAEVALALTLTPEGVGGNLAYMKSAPESNLRLMDFPTFTTS